MGTAWPEAARPGRREEGSPRGGVAARPEAARPGRREAGSPRGRVAARRRLARSRSPFGMTTGHGPGATAPLMSNRNAWHATAARGTACRTSGRFVGVFGVELPGHRSLGRELTRGPRGQGLARTRIGLDPPCGPPSTSRAAPDFSPSETTARCLHQTRRPAREIVPRGPVLHRIRRPARRIMPAPHRCLSGRETGGPQATRPASGKRRAPSDQAGQRETAGSKRPGRPAGNGGPQATRPASGKRRAPSDQAGQREAARRDPPLPDQERRRDRDGHVRGTRECRGRRDRDPAGEYDRRAARRRATGRRASWNPAPRGRRPPSPGPPCRSARW